MAEPFKNLIRREGVELAARHLWRAWPAFDERAFVARAAEGLEALELKARAMQIADALEATLPSDFGRAADLIEAALAPVAAGGGALGAADPAQGLAGWILWSVGEFVARRGQDDPVRALETLRQLTQRFSAEFAIRPFIVRHPEVAFATLERWTRDPSAAVRRLVSEGSRPRLPWGLRLNALVADPSPTLPLLRALQDDPSEDVRRSVANHLNDIAKDHPALVAAWIDEHLPGASAERRALLRHASRTLIKRGDARVHAQWGHGERLRGTALLAIRPARVALGGEVTLTLELASRSRQVQTLEIDYAVHHVKADGGTSPKVFKGWRVELPARGSLTLVKRHSLRPVTTRRYFGGRHLVQAQINGEVVAEAAFTLALPRGAAA
jgi:3-methyladenine DNA glycosylase AlkC